MNVDVAVLGGGPAGYTAAIRAAQLGANVACIEREPALGGTCLRVGCIPTKAWVQSAHAYHDARETFAKLGVRTADPSLDFDTVASWKDAVVDQMTGGVASLFKANGVEWVNGKWTFTGANTIAVEGGEDVNFKSAIVATGSFPIRPPIDGLDSPLCVDSPTWTPSLPNVSSASLSAKAVCTQALVGMQPTRRQVPPSSGSFSMQTVLASSCAARIAAV